MAKKVRAKTTTPPIRKWATDISAPEHGGESTAVVAEPQAETGRSAEPTRKQIQARAYEIYLARRGRGGNAQSDWLQAERDLCQARKRS